LVAGVTTGVDAEPPEEPPDEPEETTAGTTALEESGLESPALFLAVMAKV
jgi:hypothetical protein